MPTVVVDPAVLVQTTLIPATDGERIVVTALYLGQAGGLGYLARTGDLEVPIGPRIDASNGATQMSWGNGNGTLFEVPRGEGLVFNNQYSNGSIASHVTLTYEMERT